MKGIKILLFAFIIGFIGLVNVEAETCSYNYSNGNLNLTYQVRVDRSISYNLKGVNLFSYKQISRDSDGNLVLNDTSSLAVTKLSRDDFLNSDGEIDCDMVPSIQMDANVTSGSTWEIYSIGKSVGCSISSSVKNEKPVDYMFNSCITLGLVDNSESEEGGTSTGGQLVEDSGVHEEATADGDWDVATFCEGPVQGVFTTIGWVFFILKIVIPIILIVMGSIDLAKAVVASKDDEIKKAVGSLVKRAVLGVLIFFIPTILNFVVELIGGDDIYDENSGTFGRCTYCMLNPGECRKLAE